MSRMRRISALAGTTFALGLGLALAGAAGANAATTTTTTHPDGSVETCYTDTVVWQGATFDVYSCSRTAPAPIAVAVTAP